MPDKPKLPPLERYVRILELLAAFPDGLSLTDVATMLELPKASSHRLLRTMQESNLVAPAGSGAFSYVTGSRLRRLAYMSADTEWLEVVVRPFMRSLAAESGETCYIAKLEGVSVRSVLMEAPDTPWRGFVLPGREMHPHAAASAKAILAFQDEQTIDLALSQPLEALAANTNTDVDKVRSDYARIREIGYATCIGEIDDGLAAVAVPIVVRGPEVIYSLGMTGPLNRLVGQDLAALAEMMKAYAGRISAGLAVGLSKRPRAGG
jgi:DNA-binding IclR family transcriptional regulator